MASGGMRLPWFSIFLLASCVSAEVVTSVHVRGTNMRVDLATQVGQPFDTATIQKDVRTLWSTGRFTDIRVDRAAEDNGAAVIFQVMETQPRPLHEIRIEPSTFGLQLKLPEGTPMDHQRARQVVAQAREELKAQGFQHASVEYKLVPYVGKQVDLRLTIDPGGRVRVIDVEFAGDLAINAKALRGSLRAMRTKRVIPPFPGLWRGWRLLPAYSPEAVESDLARLQSLYISRGYLDARVRLDDMQIHHDAASVTIRVEAGRLYRVRSATVAEDQMDAESPGDLCPSLLAARRQAERQGILDFGVNLVANTDDANAQTDLAATIAQGRPYRIGRIDFSGSHHYSEAMLRRNFLLDEGQLLDEKLLRQSMARLNQTMLFEPLTERDLQIHTDAAPGVADISLRLRERKGGSWNLSGPVGPASFAGPLTASLRSRLPAWGSGLLELSTYTAAISLYAFAPPLVPALSVLPKHTFLPVLALQRPFLPGEGWRSGFYIAPQLGWRALGMVYAVTQVQQRLLPVLAGDRGLILTLPVTVETPRGESQMFCEPPAPRLIPLRTSASLALRFLGVLTGL